MATVRTLIKASLRKAGVLATGETPTHSEEQDAFDDLKRMLEVWSTKQIYVYASAEDNFALVSGTASYTMGTAGTASSTRAKKVLHAFVRDSSNYDHPVEIISEGQYNGIATKTNQARPNKLFYDPKYSLGYINLHPTPDTVETMYIESLQLLISLSALTDTVSLPGEYEEAIVSNLALRLHTEYPDVPVSPALLALANSSLADIVELNAANQIEVVGLDPGVVGGGTMYNINTDN